MPCWPPGLGSSCRAGTQVMDTRGLHQERLAAEESPAERGGQRGSALEQDWGAQKSTSHTTIFPLSPPAAANIPSGLNTTDLNLPTSQSNACATFQVAVS